MTARRQLALVASASPDFDGGVTPLHWRHTDADGDPLWTCPRCAGLGWVRVEAPTWGTICPACEGRTGFTPWTLAVALARRSAGPAGPARVGWYRRIQAVLGRRTLEGRAVRTRARTAIELLERMGEVFTP